MRKKFHVTFIGKPSISKTQIKHLRRKDAYVTYDDVNKNPFSKQKLKYGSFNTNPILKQPLFGKKGKIKMKNGSVIYYVSDHARYKKAEGKSLDNIMTDEAIIKAINKVKFWVIRAGVCVKLGDYESALNRMERALTAFDLIKVAQVYGVNVD